MFLLYSLTSLTTSAMRLPSLNAGIITKSFIVLPYLCNIDFEVKGFAKKGMAWLSIAFSRLNNYRLFLVELCPDNAFFKSRYHAAYACHEHKRVVILASIKLCFPCYSFAYEVLY